MGIDPAAVLAVISEQATRIAALEQENAQLRAALVPPTDQAP
jgi:hypothetical protein